MSNSTHSERFVETVRALTRPILAIMGLGFWGIFIGSGIEYPYAFEVAVLAMLGWWFGERLISKLEFRQNKK